MPRHKKKSRNQRNAKRLPRGPKETTNSDFINNLDDDSLATIFKYLSIDDRLTIQAVCKRWRRNPDLAWRDLRIIDSTSRQFPEALRNNRGVEKILKLTGRFLKQLKLNDGCTSIILPLVARYCNNLTRLEIELPWEDTTCTDWSPQMERLKYFKMRGNSHHFSSNFFNTLPFENLTELHLSARFADAGRLRCSAPSAAHRAFQKLSKLSAFSLEGFSLNSNILIIINQKSNLTFLSLAKCTTKWGLPRRRFPSHLINLQHLNLSRIIDVDDCFITQVVDTCKKLKILNLTDCEDITNKGILKLQKLRQLEELVLNGVLMITDESLSKMHHLRKLECGFCHDVRDTGVITLMKYASNLEYFSLYRSGVSKKVLTEAIDIIQRRTNDIQLRLCVDYRLRRFCDNHDIPPLLVLEGFVTDRHDPHYQSDISDEGTDGSGSSYDSSFLIDLSEGYNIGGETEDDELNYYEEYM